MIEPYPLNLLLNNRAVAVIGGGGVAERKVLSLLDTGANITVIAPKATKKIKSLAAKKKVVLNLRDFVHDDLKGKLLIFAATNSDEVNKQAKKINKTQRVLLQVKLSDEAKKHGVLERDMTELIEQVSKMQNLKLEGPFSPAGEPLVAELKLHHALFEWVFRWALFGSAEGRHRPW